MMRFAGDVLDKIAMGIVVLDSQMNVCYWNQWMKKKTNITSLITMGRRIFDMCPRFKEPKYSRILEGILESGQGRFLSGALNGVFFQPAVPDGDSTQVRQNLQIERIELEEGYGLLIQVNDVTSQYQQVKQMRGFIRSLEMENDEIRQSELAARRRALHDGLTGLPNRIQFISGLVKMLKSCQSESHYGAVIYLDVDDFKQVNDNYGHIMGDQLLQAVAHRLKAAVRTTDMVARLSGDEFAFLISDLKVKSDIFPVVEKIAAALNEPYEVDGKILNVTLSLGASLYPQDGNEAADLMDKADQALYCVKRSGKAGFGFYKE